MALTPLNRAVTRALEADAAGRYETACLHFRAAGVKYVPTGYVPRVCGCGRGVFGPRMCLGGGYYEQVCIACDAVTFGRVGVASASAAPREVQAHSREVQSRSLDEITVVTGRT